MTVSLNTTIAGATAELSLSFRAPTPIPTDGGVSMTLPSAFVHADIARGPRATPVAGLNGDMEATLTEIQDSSGVRRIRLELARVEAPGSSASSADATIEVLVGPITTPLSPTTAMPPIGLYTLDGSGGALDVGASNPDPFVISAAPLHGLAVAVEDDTAGALTRYTLEFIAPSSWSSGDAVLALQFPSDFGHSYVNLDSVAPPPGWSLRSASNADLHLALQCDQDVSRGSLVALILEDIRSPVVEAGSWIEAALYVDGDALRGASNATLPIFSQPKLAVFVTSATDNRVSATHVQYSLTLQLTAWAPAASTLSIAFPPSVASANALASVSDLRPELLTSLVCGGEDPNWRRTPSGVAMDCEQPTSLGAIFAIEIGNVTNPSVGGTNERFVAKIDQAGRCVVEQTSDFDLSIVATVPSPPTLAVASSRADALPQLEASWTPGPEVAGIDSAAQAFRLEYGAAGEGGSDPSSFCAAATTSDLQGVIDGLLPERIFHVRVVAIDTDSGAESVPSDAVVVTTLPMECDPGSAPDGAACVICSTGHRSPNGTACERCEGEGVFAPRGSRQCMVRADLISGVRQCLSPLL